MIAWEIGTFGRSTQRRAEGPSGSESGAFRECGVRRSLTNVDARTPSINNVAPLPYDI
jgi:hypothetical protein